MMRASGFVVGALLMLGVFLLALGNGNSPTLVKEIVSSEADTNDTVTEPAPAPALAQELAPAPAPDVPVENAVDSPELPVTDTASPAEEDRTDVAVNGLLLDPQSWNQSMAAHATDDRSDATALSRYQVWSPFRSEWAANGFARRLALATDVPVEVVNEGPGNYQVVFSYRDDGERQALVERIETVTGLELE
jgi:hypothetical protein